MRAPLPLSLCLSLCLFATAALAAEPRAVATFESIGLYWSPPSPPKDGACPVRFRRAGESAWRDGLPLWFDRRDGECRGSLVQLEPGTRYEIDLGAAHLAATTWKEEFPVARTVKVPAGKSLKITEGGSAKGYVVYEGDGAVLDANDDEDFNVAVSAPYVIVRGLHLKGAKQDAIRLLPGAHDVVIEDNDISGWGRFRYTNSKGWKIGRDMDAGVRAVCNASFQLERVVIQRNRIHDPRYGANSWSWGHPAGPQAITFSYCGGNHVIRYNEIWSSDEQHYYNDGIGGEDNFSATGFPNADTDIDGNRIANAWDDAIEAEGGNRNVRIWGNWLDLTSTGVATTVTHYGPVYIFRNVYNRGRRLSERPIDEDDRGTFAKSGSGEKFGDGRRYVFHNTLLQPPGQGRWPLGAGGGLNAGGRNQPLTNTVSRNNIWMVWKRHWESINAPGGTNNDFDYDLYNGKIAAYPGAEAHGIRGEPRYASQFALAAGSPGIDQGVRLPNFNDGFIGAAPDVGAQETGAPLLQFGVAAATNAAKHRNSRQAATARRIAKQ
jgi:hypothetical protein